jgi:methionine-S-sulfoxide reductase
MEQIIFAAGCFWGVQYYFDHIPGVTQTTVGYSGGMTEDPTYEEVCSHTTGHAEAVLVEFDTSKVSLKELCMQFFRMHDPTQLDRQGPDVGDQYRSAIYYFADEQKPVIEAVLEASASNFDKPIVTTVLPAGPFYQAEGYHQKFAERTGRGMCHIPYKALS